MEPLDLSPIDLECMRCHRVAPMRFYGLCTGCREQLHTLFDREARTVDVPEWEPKLHVTPNAVALRPD
jgi:hypothetical protein